MNLVRGSLSVLVPARSRAKAWLLGLGLGVGGLALASGCKQAVSAVSQSSAAPVTVKTARVKRGESTRAIILPGTIRAFQQATLYAKVSGYLKEISVDKGDRVQKGQRVADIEVPELLAEQAKDKAETTMLEIDFTRVAAAHDQAPDLVTQQSVDKSRGSYEMAKANLARVETLLSFAKIIAPFSGVVTRRFVDPGAFIPAATAGSAPSNAALVTIADFSVVRVQVAVPEPEVSRITNGLTAAVKVDALAGKIFSGRITRYARALDEATKTMLTEVDIPNPREELRPGMYVKVEIAIESRPNVLTVPASAIFKDESKECVFTVSNGKAKKALVTLGQKDGNIAEVLNGLAPNEEVILMGAEPLSDGQAVVIQEIE